MPLLGWKQQIPKEFLYTVFIAKTKTQNTQKQTKNKQAGQAGLRKPPVTQQTSHSNSKVWNATNSNAVDEDEVGLH